MLGPVENLGYRSLFHHFAGIENDDAVADLGNGAKIVRDEQDRSVDRGSEFAQQMQDLRFQRHIKGGGHLVGDEQIWLGQQAHGDCNALAHAAGELKRIAVELARGVGNADAVQGIDSLGPLLRFRQRLLTVLNIQHVLADAAHRVERGHRVLKDHGDAGAANGAHLVFG